MSFFADLHIHSKYSRATSRNCDFEHLAWWAARKGIAVVGTGDFTHPAWFDEIRNKLVPAEPGLFRLRPEIEREVLQRLPLACRRPTRFLLEVEISTIYKKGDKTRKVHHLIYAPDLETAGRFRDRLGQIGNISSDGRPILGLDSRHLLEITLESGPDAYLVPAHIWTPWFAAMGSKSGFDSIEECYGDLSEHIFAVETGLSSDPPMNWRVSSLDKYTLVSNSDAHSPPMLGREACVFHTELDYFAMRKALETGQGYGGTMEFFPEEGKYHMDGHRSCGVCLEPDETRRHRGRCPQCGKPVTVGVMHRVESLADRPEGTRPENASPFQSLVPLPEIVSELEGVGPRSKRVEGRVSDLVARLGPELQILGSLPIEDFTGDPLLLEAVDRLRNGNVRRQAGYDGEYGTIRLFDPEELKQGLTIAPLFELPQVPKNTPDTNTPPPPHPTVSELETPGTPPGSSEDGAQPVRAGEGRVARGGRGFREFEHRPQEEPGGVPGVSSPDTALRPPTLLDSLDADQRRAAEITHGPLLIVAGPGTGKTRTLTYRLAHLVETGITTPEHCLALTFTRRAAEEMKERLESLLGPQTQTVPAQHLTVSTFHGLGLTLLRELREEVDLPEDFRIVDETERLGRAKDLFGLSLRRTRRLLEDLTHLRHQRVLSQIDPGDQLPIVDEDAAARLRAYEEALATHHLVDFDDLLLRPVELLSRREDLCKAYRERFQYLFLDEYQDIDPLQYRLVRLLAPADGNVCAIGDPDQSIYSFRGAEVAFFLRFRQDFPGAQRIELRRNYRSSHHIVTAACQAIAPSSLVAHRELRAVLPKGDARLVIRPAASERAEAEQVVHTMEKLLGGTSHFSLDSGRVDNDGGGPLSFDDLAVLYRTDAQSRVLMEALERSGIPYQKRSHERLADRPGVRELLTLLREHEASDEFVHGLLDRAALQATEPKDTDREETEATHQAIRSARDLLAPLARRFAHDLPAFLAEVALGAEVDTWDPRAQRVSLLTLHAAKGLEFPVVFIVGCADGLLPLSFDDSDNTEDLNEERRLFFVGLTRAERRLFLSYPKRRTWRGRTVDAAASPFLQDIDKALLEMRSGGEKTARKAQEGPRQLSLLPP